MPPSRRSRIASSRWPSSSSWSRSSRPASTDQATYRPARRAQDAIAEIVHFTKAPSNYEWVIETDVEACFDRLPHCLIGDEVRRRIADKRVLALVRAFLKAGVMTETAACSER
jgi:retron-type reverse transcriptase